MLKRVTLSFCFLFMILSAISVVRADWWMDVHYDSRLPYADDEAYAIYQIMKDEPLGSEYYTVWVLQDWCKQSIVEYSLPYAKVWHMASHGGIDYWGLGNNFLLTHYDEKIYGGDVPDLSNVHGGGAMILAFASACISGASKFWPWQYMLYQGFLDKGALAYMGYKDQVGDYDAYRFAYYFYLYASGDATGYSMSIGDAKSVAEQLVPSVKDNIQLYGNPYVLIVYGETWEY